MQPEDPPGPGERVALTGPTRLRNAIKDAWPFVPAAIAVVFAVERFFTSVFYRRFGVSTDEVGIGVLHGLVEGVVLFLAVYIALNVVVFGVVVDWVLRTLQAAANRFRRGQQVPFARDVAGEEQRRNRIVLGLTGVFVALFFVVAPSVQVFRDADAARDGSAVSGWPIVPWSAQPAVVTRLDDPSAAVDDLGRRCLMYLGHANGVTVLFDVAAQATLRLPTSSLVVGTGDLADAVCPGND